MVNNYDNRRYVIFNVSEINVINFNEVLEDSMNTLRYSLDESKSFVKYDGSMPSSVSALTTKQGPYTHSEILSILTGPEWTDPNIEV